MKQKPKGKDAAAGLFGVIPIALAACVACRIPLIVPILAWLGLSVLGATATGWYLAMIGIFALGMAAVILYRHWEQAQLRRTQKAAAAGRAAKSSGCEAWMERRGRVPYSAVSVCRIPAIEGSVSA